MKTIKNFQSKLFFSFTAFILVMSILSMVFWNVQLKLAQDNSVAEQLTLLCSGAEQEIQSVLNQAEAALYLHTRSSFIQDILLRMAEGTLSDSSREIGSEALKEGILLQNSGMLISVCYTDPSGIYFLESGKKYNRQDILDRIEAAKALNGLPNIGDPRRETINDEKRYVLPLSKEMINPADGSSIGFVLVDLDYSALCSRIDASAVDKCYTVVAESGTCIYQTNIRNDSFSALISSLDSLPYKPRAGAVMCFRSRTYCVCYITEKVTGWKVYKIRLTPVHALSQPLLVFIVFSILLSIAAIFVAKRLSKEFSHNITVLRDTFHRAGSSPVLEPVPVRLIREDDVGVLIHSYNHMVSRFNNAVEREYSATIQAKEMQIRMLSYQINPHFLYNCLNLISSMAIIRNAPEIAHVSRILGDMFRYSIDSRDKVSLREELTHLKHYLELQAVRLPDSFQVIYDIDESLLDMTCLKFFLQPVVENSFSHGFSSAAKTKNELIVGLSRHENDAVFSILDNGTGISSDELSEINRLMNSNDSLYDSDHIGLKNIQQRLRSVYGPDYGISISSQQGIYTHVTIRFPLEVPTA